MITEGKTLGNGCMKPPVTTKPIIPPMGVRNGKMLIQWEKMDEYTHRLRVFGGWIVKHVSYYYHESVSESSVFVPDPNHEWDLKEEVE